MVSDDHGLPGMGSFDVLTCTLTFLATNHSLGKSWLPKSPWDPGWITSWQGKELGMEQHLACWVLGHMSVLATNPTCTVCKHPLPHP